MSSSTLALRLQMPRRLRATTPFRGWPYAQRCVYSRSNPSWSSDFGIVAVDHQAQSPWPTWATSLQDMHIQAEKALLWFRDTKAMLVLITDLRGVSQPAAGIIVKTEVQSCARAGERLDHHAECVWGDLAGQQFWFCATRCANH